MQHLQYSVLHEIRKYSFCHVQRPVDNEEQKDYQCGRGISVNN